ncbi:Membrane protein insertase YidC [Candidatus Providencia siddallii]|uniref:Membrane protein insertase YidC n=1 Tax=Candidatus Providencia siddallii TaxID=1715285 RepID=A0A0M6W832_9GAMM|nr:Membrane protein insertase YidC [Candidatus Providencia siddallii]
MDLQRKFLFVVFLITSALIWRVWENEKITQDAKTVKIIEQMEIQNNKFIDKAIENKYIVVKTDVLKIRINKVGGDIDEADLLVYNKNLYSKNPFRLLETGLDFVYQAQSGLTGPNGPDNPFNNNGKRPCYATNSDYFELQDNQDVLFIPMIFIGNDNVVYKKIYTVKRGKYSVDVKYSIQNKTNSMLNIAFFGQLKQTAIVPKHRDTKTTNFALRTYRGAAYSSNENAYKKYSISDIKTEDLNLTTKGGWVAMLQQYFAVAWIPNGRENAIFYSAFLDNKYGVIGYKTIPLLIKPNSVFNYSSTLWIGPEIQSEMAKISSHLDLTVDYGWLWFISQPLFRLLKFIHNYVGNWGISIIIITFILRGIMYPLTKAQYTSMAKMRLLQPKLIEIRERFNNDKQRMSQEMMTIYKSEKVNPLGGCLPLLIQMPIFLALYYMLMSSVELRHASFFGWVKDLSAQDPYYILPVLMGLSMFVIQKISPSTSTEPMQQKIITYIPIIFTIFFLWFPSGLVLYYVISNLVTIIQQQIIYKSLENRGLYNRDKKNRK